ncbi:MAG: hypothetical protein WC974_07600 [Thermoplasmata archaeon]
MNKKQISQEWKKLKFEIFENKPKIDGPYPPDIVKRRELLLFAQVHLTNISDAKNKKDGRIEGFETKLYNTVMSAYCNWDTANEKIYNFSYK